MSSLNVRAEKRRLTTVGVFCPRTTAELGDRPGLVSARMVSLILSFLLSSKINVVVCVRKTSLNETQVRLLASVGFSNHSLRNQIMEARDRYFFLTKI